jgi:hypothetical protein
MHRTKSLAIFVSILFLFPPIHAVSHEILTALLAGDTLSDLESSVKRDMANVKTLLSDIRKYTGTRVKTEELSDKNLTVDNVREWIAGVKKSQPQIALIYYSGHGYRTSSTPSSWPLLFFSKTHESLNSERLLNELKETGARLVIILLDCCNSPSFQTPFGFLGTTKGIELENKKYPGFKTLFLQTKGTVIGVGASPGEPAYAFHNGSLFTTSLIKTIRSSTTAKTVSWNTILEHTAHLCSRMQRPLCLVQTADLSQKSHHHKN